MTCKSTDNCLILRLFYTDNMENLNLDLLETYVFEKSNLLVESKTYDTLMNSFSFLESFSKDKIIYGINTGFGPMAQIRIEPENLHDLQYNLIRSHSTGVGNPLPPLYARSVVLARLNNFLQANSGISSGVVKQLELFINNDIAPEIPEHGSVGASGDLVQLAHLGLNLIGEGNVFYKGEKRKTEAVFNELNIAPFLKKNINK